MPKKSSKGQVARSKGAANKTKNKGVVKKRQDAKVAVKRAPDSGARLLQTPKRYWYRPLTWRHRPPVPAYEPLPKARTLFAATLKQLWRHKKLFGGIVTIYGLLNLLLVRGLSGSSDLGQLKSALDSLTHGVGGKISSSLASFAYLLASSGSGNTATSGMYQSVLLIICSLAFIWALRQVLANHTVRIRDSFYQGMYPLVPFMLTFLLLGVQLLPLVIGGSLYSTVISNGIAVHFWEKTLWLVLFIGLGLWSLRMITASVFAVYITTLPDMTPLRAYRSARQLVYGRRLYIWRKLIFLPVVLLLLAAAIELPLILFLTPVAAWIFFALSMLALPIVHSYLYNLYREML
jgi:hypothetical protein